MARVMVSLPDDLLAELDRTAKQRGTTRSGLLADTAGHELMRHDSAAERAAIDRMVARAAKYGGPTLDDVLSAKRERDARDLTR